MSQLLQEESVHEFKKYKNALKEGLSSKRAHEFDKLAEHVRNQQMLLEASTPGSTGAGNISTLNKVLLPLMRRILPTVIANELIGIQPMDGPVGQINTFRMVYSDTYGGVTAGTEALSPFAIANGYSGEGTQPNGMGSATSILEGQAGRQLTAQTLKQIVEAKTRRLSASWTFEAAQDANSQYGLDLESELITHVSQHLVTEIDTEIIQNLFTLAGAPLETFDQDVYNAAVVNADREYRPTFVGDKHAVITNLVHQAANEISSKTRLGAGNWLVVTPKALTTLQSAQSSALVKTTEGSFEAPNNTKFVGTLNGAIKVYVDSYRIGSPVEADDNILVGYKADDNTAAMFYCPYVPLMTTGTVLNPVTLQPVIGFLTRYGLVQLNNQASSLGNAGDFVAKIAIKNLKFM